MSKLGKKPINIPKDTKVKIESGKVNPTLFTLWELADGLKIPLREFLDF